MIHANNDSVNELIARHLAGETSATEEKELFSWISQSDDNKRQYDNLKKAFDLTENHFAAREFQNLPVNVDDEWHRFIEATGTGTKTRHLAPMQIWWKVAAAVLLLFATGGILYFFTMPDASVYQTAGSKQTVTLPDGSHVTLNRYTVLSLYRDFGESSRTVALDGEAFFDVASDMQKPFIILTGQAKVQVLGTSFNVNAYDSLSDVEVIVSTGVVALQANTGDQKVELAAGQKGIYSKANDRIAKAVNRDVNFLSWNTGRMVFVEKDLQSVIETLEKTYHAQITISADMPATCIVTVTFDDQSLESVLKVLENTLNLKYTLNGNKVVITEAGC